MVDTVEQRATLDPALALLDLTMDVTEVECTTAQMVLWKVTVREATDSTMTA